MQTIAKRMLELLKDKNKWTKDEMAKDNEDNAVSPYSNEATSFCLVGALWHVCEKDENEILEEKKMFAALRKYPKTEHVFLEDFNDDEKTKHRDILAFLHYCIKEGL